MFWTTIPTYIITLIIFTVLGIQQTSGGYTAGDISNYITELNGEFHLGAVTLIPAILIIVLLLCKVNAISALGISSFAAGAVSFLYSMRHYRVLFRLHIVDIQLQLRKGYFSPS